MKPDALYDTFHPETLRDKLAMAALTGLIMRTLDDVPQDDATNLIATLAYSIADAMMKARVNR